MEEMSYRPPEAIKPTEQGEIIIPTTLYHGSRYKLEELDAMQAQSEAEEGVPEGELLRGIYLTPDYEVALAMGARPDGVTRMEEKDGKRTINFESPDAFDPDREVYVYRVKTERVPRKNITKVDDSQFVITGMDSVKPDSVEVKKAGDIFEYYEQV